MMESKFIFESYFKKDKDLCIQINKVLLILKSKNINLDQY